MASLSVVSIKDKFPVGLISAIRLMTRMRRKKKTACRNLCYRRHLMNGVPYIQKIIGDVYLSGSSIFGAAKDL